MLVKHAPDPIEKLAVAGKPNRFEAVGDNPQSESKPLRQMPSHKRDDPIEVDGVLSCITEVTTPTGKKPVLKAMMTTACEKNCYYCPFRAGRSRMRRVTFSPDEMAATFDKIQRAGLVEGIFLSSGIIKGGVTTQDKVIDTIEIIRRKYRYRGYIHLKIMPGAEYDQLKRAMQLADRVSVNLEGPTSQRLNALAPKKDFETELLGRIRWAHQVRRELYENGYPHKLASVVTQFVVGAVGDTDVELLSVSEGLYRRSGLARAYYSRFNPVLDTPFENLPPVSALREHRLYQASFLLRDYDWDVEDLPFEGNGNLLLDIDPKQAWADQHLIHNPVEVMQASRRELMRVPGFGDKAARAILRARKLGALTDLGHLRALGIAAPERSAPYILLNGHRPPRQLTLFD